MNHEWVKSTLGHGETMCRACMMTNREAAVLGKLNDCDVLTRRDAEAKAKAKADNAYWDDPDTYGYS